MVTEEKVNAEIKEECVTEFICTSMPVAYRLRKTRNGGVELLGGYPVSEYRNLKKVDERIAWHVIPMLEADQLPRP